MEDSSSISQTWRNIFGSNFRFTNGNLTQSGTVGSASFADVASGYAWRVQNRGAINVDFGANDYADSWIESYQNGTTVGKPLNINSKYGGFTKFGGLRLCATLHAPEWRWVNGDACNKRGCESRRLYSFPRAAY